MFKRFRNVALALVFVVATILPSGVTPVKAGYYFKVLNTNGDFEATDHDAGWGQYHNDEATPCAYDCVVSTYSSPYSGSYHAWLGGITSASDFALYPATAASNVGIDIPANASKVTLNYHYKIVSDDTTTNDHMYARVADANSWALLSQYSYTSNNDETDWTTGTIDITPYIDHELYFYFRLDNDAIADTITSFFVDNVTLVAQFTDYAAPTSNTISINSGSARTKSASATLALSSTDSNAGVDVMRLSNNNSTWSGWYDYATSKSWNITDATYGGNGSQGTKRVYVQYKDKAGNISSTVNDSIIYDTVGPVGTIKIKNGASSTTSSKVTLKLSATDGAGVSKMRFSNNGKAWSSWMNYATSKTNWNMTSSTYGGTKKRGKKYVYVQYKDALGNVAVKKRDYIKYK